MSPHLRENPFFSTFFFYLRENQFIVGQEKKMAKLIGR